VLEPSAKPAAGASPAVEPAGFLEQALCLLQMKLLILVARASGPSCFHFPTRKLQYRVQAKLKVSRLEKLDDFLTALR